ncbi:MAG: hypothetical protein O7B81_12380 [Gammaproteobacteria bacterium]|nr:hypothetical protein [Gammaproteobacteria bacterium]
MDQTTRLGTLWSQTLMDVLCIAVQQQREEKAREVLKEMRVKRYRKDQIRKYAAKNLEPAEVVFLERLLKPLSGK